MTVKPTERVIQLFHHFCVESSVDLSSCSVYFVSNGLVIDCQTTQQALTIWGENHCWLAYNADRLAISRIKVSCGDEVIADFSTEKILKTPECQIKTRFESMTPSSFLNQSFLETASYADILEIVRLANNGITITGMLDDRCLHVNSQMNVQQTSIYPWQWIGIDFKLLWRDSWQQREQLLDLLRRDGYVMDFTYDLRRPDGRMGRYTKDYYLIEDFLETSVRLSVSKEWELLPEVA